MWSGWRLHTSTQGPSQARSDQALAALSTQQVTVLLIWPPGRPAEEVLGGHVHASSSSRASWRPSVVEGQVGLFVEQAE